MADENHHVENLAQMFRILGDPTRLRILLTLKEGEVNVTGLCEALQLPQPTVSRHLGILRMGGLVSNRRSGKEIFYSLSLPQQPRYARNLRSMLGQASKLRFGEDIFD